MLRVVIFSLILLPGIALAVPPDLPDQYGHEAGLDDFTGKPVLVIVSQARKLRWVGRWEETLRAEIPHLNSLRVADVVEEPRPTFDDVAEVLQKRVPEGVGIQIDLNNDWAREYQLDTKEPCLLVFDANHALLAQFRGRPKRDLPGEVLAELAPLFPAPAEDIPAGDE